MEIKLILVVTLFAGVYSNPLIQEKYETSHRWVSVPDTNGKMHLIDLNYVETEPEPSYDPTTDVVYRLFTRSNSVTPHIITRDMDTVRSSFWNPNHGVRVLIHGWNGGGAGTNGNLMREFLSHDEYNVITIDWGAGAQTPNYLLARNRVGPTGAAIADLLSIIIENGLSQHRLINVVGHSLGAHVGGHIGKSMRGGRINAIFGTDAAGPLFNINAPAERFDIGDADYTENIHTNTGSLGFDEPITHAAFYPAWGTGQPGCSDNSCDHGRSNALYAESLRPNHLLIGRQCTGYSEILARNCPGTGVFGSLGGDINKTIRGVFFLETNAQSPFGRG